MKTISLFNKTKVHPSWNDFIYDNENLQELQNIENAISTYKEYFPLKDKVFRFLENDLSAVKYIVLGMDPYPSYYVENGTIIPIATGRSFEVSNIKSWKQKFKQKSLAEILKTLYYDKYKIEIPINDLRDKIIEIDFDTSNEIIHSIKTNYLNLNININNNNSTNLHDNSATKNNYKEILKNEILKYLDLTQKDLNNVNKDKKIILFNPTSFYDITELQGILWLNSTLTVAPNNSGSHMKIWNNYMNHLFRYISSKNNNIKYLVFGEQAKNRLIDIVNKKNMIITCHPASRFNNDFVTSDCFKKVNDILLYL